MENKKKITIVVIIVISLVIVTILGIFIINKKEESKDANINKVEIKEEDIKYFNLYQIASELYNNKEYLKFPMINDNIYYASKQILIDYEYDVSMIDSSCEINEPIVYFDVNNKLNDNYELEPIIMKLKCKD